jgi:hypothetical protein
LDAIINLIQKGDFKMSKTWKWVLGILLVLVVVAALVAVPLVMHSYMAANPSVLSQARGWNTGPMMRGNDGWQGQPGQNFGPGRFDNRGGPMMGGERGFDRGFSRFGGFAGPFGFGLMFLGGLLRLIPLALFGLLLYGVYQLGKRSGMRSTLSPAPISTPPAAVSEEKPVE